MNRIDLTFRKLKKERRKAFIPYVTGGDPNLYVSKKIVDVLIRSGADIIEIGIPFSDPMADGPIIQRAIARALSGGATSRKIFNMVRKIRKNSDTPIVFMTYYNIIYNYGPANFVRDAKKCGADGIIVPDLPMEESGLLRDIAMKSDFSLILLAAPTTGAPRFKKISSLSSGFIYYVSLTGVTGVR